MNERTPMDDRTNGSLSRLPFTSDIQRTRLNTRGRASARDRLEHVTSSRLGKGPLKIKARRFRDCC